MNSSVGITNDPEMEKLGANEAATHALSWWRTITAASKLDRLSLDCTWDDCDDMGLQDRPGSSGPLPEPETCGETAKVTVTHSSKNDRLMYGRFRSNFSIDDVALVGGEDRGAFKLNSEKWRSVLVACEGIIKDHSRMTLLRTSAWGEFWMTAERACGGMVIVPRAQWQFVEIARVKEGYYGRGFRRMLEKFELGIYRERVEKCLDAMEVGGEQEAAEIFHAQGVVYHPEPVLTVEEVSGLRSMATRAFDDLMSEQLEPRGLTLEDSFDFNEVRHRPGNRLDNRYKVDAGVVTSNGLIMDYVNRVFGTSDAGEVEVLYAGVVHAWGKEEGAEPDVQVWHRDGPTLLGGGEKGRGHRTHCLNLFIPLCDVGKENGATEPSLPSGGFLMFDIRTLHRGGANLTPVGRDVLYVTFAWNWWRDIHMFDSKSLVEGEVQGVMRDFVNGIGGGRGEIAAFGEGYGHPHFTRRWRTMVLEGLLEGGEGGRRARRNAEGCRKFMEMARSKSRNDPTTSAQDFTSLTDDFTDVGVLYGCLNSLLVSVMLPLGFTSDKMGVGATTMIALIKSEVAGKGDSIERAFTNWYHGGTLV
ncbi:hypothetical protein TrRE_jg4080, partial [Triparma retinervis]